MAVAAVFLVLAKFAFEVKTIDLKDQDSCLKQIDLKKEYIGKNLLLINPKKEQNSLKDKNSCVDGVAVERKFPITLQITVKSKVPVAKIDGTELLATSDGLLIKKQITANIPTIYLPNSKSLKENETLQDKTAIFALQISSGLLKSDFTPASIRLIGSNDIAVYSTSGIIALFTTNQSASDQVDSLQSIMTKAKIDASKIEKIDLRFNKPTVVFK